MSPRTIKLLHIEDNVAERLLVAKLLGAMKDCTFNIVRAATEITALQEFGRGDVGFVILDYRLPQGDGLDCTRKLRQMSPTVPILALSAIQAPDLPEKFLQAGADEFLSKEDLAASTEKLGKTIRKVLARAEALPLLVPVFEAFAATAGTDWLKPLDEVEHVARQAGLTATQIQRAFETVCAELDKSRPPQAPPARQVLRPVMLELILRVTGSLAGYSDKTDAAK